MKKRKLGMWIARSALATILLIMIVSIAGCQVNQTKETATPDWNPFIELARGADCADIKNRLFVIDHTLVLSDRQGNCADASYSVVLYGKTVDDLLCTSSDSIAGPRKSCRDQSREALFEIITTHLDDPNLGLDSSHTVEQLQL